MVLEKSVAWSPDRLPPTHRAWVEIDLGAVRRNLLAIRRLLQPGTLLMSVVKADGYGHGAQAVAGAALAAGASWLAVATVEEGIQLRQAGIDAPILLFAPAVTKEEMEAICLWGLQPTVCGLDQARRFSELGQPEVPVHVKIDTGMSRLGAAVHEAINLLSAVRNLANVRVASVYSHMATADVPDPIVADEQLARFRGLIRSLEEEGLRPPLVHLANSAATLGRLGAQFDLVRIGLAQYGLYPAPHFRTLLDLQPALTLKARIVFVKTVPPGTGVSYGHTFRTRRSTRLATVAVGYADGMARGLSNRIDLLVRGRRVPQVGTITMDQCLIDVTEVPEAVEGDVVTLIGTDGAESVPAGDWADRLETIPYEVLCALGRRLPRIHLHG
jgi:alanine racemase